MRRLLRILLRTLLVVLALYALLYVANRPFRSSAPVEAFAHLSHRGVYQTYHRRNLNNFTCTAARIDPPRHAYLENTLPSLRAAFAAGADRVEIDVHRTADGQIVVFHDWTVDCRTEGKGETRTHTLAQLQALDAGYGYTADGGRSFPFRGRAVGAIPSLRQVLAAFPDGQFLINQKDRFPETTARVAEELQAAGAVGRACLQTEGARKAAFLAALGKDACTFADRSAIKRCLVDYLITGGMGELPPSCRGESLIVFDGGPMRVLWGWPGTFLERIHAHGGKVYVWTDDTSREPALRATGFDGVFTDRIELWR
jgi:glycerophosphoryl diester phosphodiesterase